MANPQICISPKRSKEMKSTVLTLFLLFTGSLGVIIGGCLLFVPVTFEASAGIYISNDPSVLSEIRGSGGMLLGAGILIVSGSLIKSMTRVSLFLSTLFYLSYGISRVIGILLDGIPSNSIIQITIAEIIIGIISIVFLLRFTKQETSR
jgi:hypothetical protein